MTAKPKTPTKTQKVFAAVDPEAKIHKTTNYEKFKRLPGNRPLRAPHINDLKEKMLEHDLKIPVLVNKQMEIIDGQHTIEARRLAGLPVYYMIGEKMTLKDVQVLNSSSLPWTNDDYANSFIELGNKHYKTYKSFRNKYGFPHEVAILLLSGRDMTQMRKLFREGAFRVADLADAEEKAEMITQLKDYTRGFRQDVFVRALMIAIRRVGFSFAKFVERAHEQRMMFSYWPKIDQNLLMIEEIYNKGQMKKVPVRFAQNVREPKPEPDDEKEEVTDDTEGNGKAGKPRGKVVTVGGRVVGVSARAK